MSYQDRLRAIYLFGRKEQFKDTKENQNRTKAMAKAKVAVYQERTVPVTASSKVVVDWLKANFESASAAKS